MQDSIGRVEGIKVVLNQLVCDSAFGDHFIQLERMLSKGLLVIGAFLGPKLILELFHIRIFLVFRVRTATAEELSNILKLGQVSTNANLVRWGSPTNETVVV